MTAELSGLNYTSITMEETDLNESDFYKRQGKRFQ